MCLTQIKHAQIKIQKLAYEGSKLDPWRAMDSHNEGVEPGLKWSRRGSTLYVRHVTGMVRIT